jgi:diguanylate cyclase
MRNDSGEHERTLAFAQIALDQIKALRLSAAPYSYEVWYRYATGYHPALNRAINAALRAKGTLTDSDIEAIHATHVASSRLADQADEFGGKIAAEIAEVMATIEAAAGTATTYNQSLADATNQLGRANDHGALRAIVEDLVGVTKEIGRSHQTLEARLKASKEEINELQENLQAVRHESLTDPLTTLGNRKFFDQALAKAVGEARDSGEPLSLAMIDIDNFKAFNDTYGHLTGDEVLRLVAATLKQNVKDKDIPARYGGEEFTLILPRMDLERALSLTDRIREAVRGKELLKRSTGEHLGRITISAGVASWREGETGQALLERADACLYAAKRNGRNRALSEAHPESTSEALVA